MKKKNIFALIALVLFCIGTGFVLADTDRFVTFGQGNKLRVPKAIAISQTDPQPDASGLIVDGDATIGGSLSIGTTDLGTLNGATGAVSGQVVKATVGALGATFNLSGCTTGQECKKSLYLTNPGAGTVAWQYGGASRTPKYVSGSAPTYTASGLDIIIVTSMDGGTTLNLFVVGQDMK